MSEIKPCVILNISVAYFFFDFVCVVRQICPYLKILEMLAVFHYKLFGGIFHEVRLFCYLTYMNGTSMLEDCS